VTARPDGVEIRALGPGDDAAVAAAAALFDGAPRADATRRFLADPGHHLLVAYAGGVPAGFVSGVELTHPDKGTEMFLYELGVDEAFRNRGIGRALVAALRDLARERGCYGMWVLTDDDNAAALGAYRAAGGGAPDPQVMLSWEFDA
jgi:ribosomal protein S18 acetylase RimI-like enzyme